jgi:alkyl sulfatase BDS1-like metallo-beta-lactamase superfamily hydrolase
MLWVKSLDRMRALPAEFLVPHHTRPVVGADVIHETLTNYRDAIQFVHDQTIRWMNRGLTPDEIVERVKLPLHLAEKPYLQEHYGTVPWSVRAIFDGYLGWFGGNATDLYPLAPRERAKRMAKLAGGEEAMLRYTREAASAQDHQWVLELADHLLRLNPENPEARQIKASALKALAERQTAATGRNYYLTQALEVEGKLRIGRVATKDLDVVHAIPLTAIFTAMSVNLDPAKSVDVNQKVGFRFPDTGEAFTIHVRRGVAEIRPELADQPETLVTVNSLVWKEIAAGARNPALAFNKGDVQIEGSTFGLVKFLGLFKSDDP